MSGEASPDQLLAFASMLTRERAGFVPPRDLIAVNARLAPLARREGYGSVWALLAAAQRNPASKLGFDLVEALAPRDTYFFRDRKPFETLAGPILAEAAGAAARGAPLRVWCAGCGTGQEAYSVAMLVAEAKARGEAAQAEILATDFSPVALNRAAAGVYSQFEVQRGLSIRRLVDHFEKDGEAWRVHAALRKTVTFTLSNLLHDVSKLGQFDVVLLRHVLSALHVEARSGVLARVVERLRPDGWLVLGSTEAAFGQSDALEPVPGAPGVYRRIAGASAAPGAVRAA